jgi:pimeloyl-ACP methyl ester carboxylesterase
MDESLIRFRHIATNGIRLHVAEAGPPDGPLVVLLHGFPEFWYGWRAQIPALAAAGFHVLAPDQRGYNLSDKPAWLVAYRLEALVDDIVGLITAAGYAQAAVVGHDWGGAVAWGLALTRPQHVRRLVALNTAPPQALFAYTLHHPSQALKSLYILGFQTPRLPEIIWRANNFRLGLRALTGTSRPGTFTPADLAQYKTAWSQPGAQTAMLNWYRAARRYPFPTGDAHVTAPTLILWGEQDAFLETGLARESAKLCDRVEVVTFPHATHWLQHEEPVAVNAGLIHFLQTDREPAQRSNRG